MRPKITGHNATERLLSSAKQVKHDMLMRAELAPDGTKLVNMSASVWRDFCNAIKEMENR